MTKVCGFVRIYATHTHQTFAAKLNFGNSAAFQLDEESVVALQHFRLEYHSHHTNPRIMLVIDTEIGADRKVSQSASVFRILAHNSCSCVVESNRAHPPQ